MIRYMVAASLLAFTAAAVAAQDGPPSPTPAPGSYQEKTTCKYVLTAEHGSKPYKLCLTNAQWKLANVRGGNDPNRIECHIQDDAASKLSSYKICQPASQWQQDRQDARDLVERIQQGSCVGGGGPCL